MVSTASTTPVHSDGDEKQHPLTPIQMSYKEAPLPKKRSLLLRIIPLVYKCGGTAHLTQLYVEKLTSLLEIDANISFLPGRVLLTWPTSSIGEDELSLLSSPMTSIDVALALQCRWGFRISTLQNFDNLLELMKKDPALPLSTITARLSAIEAEPPRYGTFTLLFAFALLAAPMAPAFFGGSLLDGLVTFIIGLIAGAFALLSDRSSTLLLPLHEMLCSFVCALLTIFFVLITADTSQPISFWPVVLASTIWILPGFSMVIGTIDIASKAGPLPGFMMLFGGLFVALIMGLSYASAIWVMSIEDPSTLLRFSAPPHLSLDLITSTFLCAIFAIACCMIYQARPSHIPIAVISTQFCFLFEYFLRVILLFPDEIVHFLVAFSLGLFLRISCRAFKQVPQAALYTAMLPLVPGSRIVRAAFALLASFHGADCDGENAMFYKTVFGSISICAIVAFGILSSEIVLERLIIPLMTTGKRKYSKELHSIS